MSSSCFSEDSAALVTWPSGLHHRHHQSLPPPPPPPPPPPRDWTLGAPQRHPHSVTPLQGRVWTPAVKVDGPQGQGRDLEEDHHQIQLEAVITG